MRVVLKETMNARRGASTIVVTVPFLLWVSEPKSEKRKDFALEWRWWMETLAFAGRRMVNAGGTSKSGRLMVMNT